MQYIQQPQAIEAKSFDIISEIIAETRPDYRFASPLHEAIIKRVIHTTADFEWLDILWFSPDALIALSEALSRPLSLIHISCAGELYATTSTLADFRAVSAISTPTEAGAPTIMPQARPIGAPKAFSRA